jgi:hypothetical protein
MMQHRIPGGRHWLGDEIVAASAGGAKGMRESRKFPGDRISNIEKNHLFLEE